jgi:hypothetical protein
VRVVTTFNPDLVTMNPNSANQMWSKWTITIVPGKKIHRSYEEVKLNAARFIRQGFGSTTQVNIDEKLVNSVTTYGIMIRTERHPVHDPEFVAHCKKAFLDFFTVGFGVGTKVTTEVKLEAGSKQDGTPAEQLLILPTIRFTED